MSAINEYLKRLASIFGSMGFSVPPDDFSGVVIDGKTYPVMMRNDGCYVYFDDKGVKRLVSEVPKKDYQFINIKDARVSIVNQCYRTPGGQVEARIHTYMNNKGEILAEKIFIINSSDVDTPIGTELDKIPAEWVAIDCSIAEMTDRELIFVSKCYATEGGKVQIEGVESVDPRLNPEVSHYEVVNTTDDSNPIGTEYDKIPDTWSRIVCDFPDMTQREIIPVLKCFDTGTGRVQIEGYKIFDYEMGTRKEWYRVKQSTDPDNPVGKFITSISDDWVEVVCDFTDMEDRDIEVTVECYKTPAGKVKLEVLTSWDGNIGVRDKSYKVLETTDPSQPEGASFSSLPDTWVRTVCDFDDMEERDIRSYVECYDGGNGNVKLRRLVSYDSKIKARYVRFEVLESDDAGFVPGAELATLPDGFSLVSCDFTDMEDRMPIDIEECYKTSAGSVRMRHVVSYDGDLGKRNQFWEIVDSSDNGYRLGSRINNIPAYFIRERCGLERLDDRITRNAVECYSTPGGSVRIKSTYVINPLNHVRSYNHHVLSSTDNDIHVGTQYTSLPSNFTRIECEEPDYMDRLIDTTETCYDTGKGTVKIRRQESLNGNLDVKTFDYKIVESTDPDHPINTTPTQTIINGWTVISCDLNIMDVDDCYEIGGHKIHLKGFRTVNPALQDIKSILYVVYSDHPDYNVGDELTSIPDGAKVTICDYADKSQRHMVPVRECYEMADGRFYVEGSRLIDNNMVVERTSLMVMESSSPTYPVGTTLTSIPDGATIVACLCQTSMVKVCNDYYMIDALAGGEVIRKRKYRRENTMIGYKWYDYNGVEVTDPIEISRLDGLATKHQRVDEAYDDHAIFMSSTNYVNSVSGIPMDKHMVVVEWRPDSERGFVTMDHDEGLDGDSYYIVVINAGDKQATIYTPVDPEDPKDGTSRAVDGDNVSVGGSYVSISPKQVERIRVTFRDGKWYYELVTKTYPSNTGGIKIGDVDFVTFRYLWESSSGRDLDTMTEALNSNVPTIDNLAVGWSGPGNGDSSVREVLKWGGDNTGSGKECVWMSVKDLRAKYYDILPEETYFMAYATWFGSKGTGKCSFELVGYKGGTMSQDGYNFINTGGSVVHQNTYDFVCHTSKGSSTYKTSYEKVARVTYNKLTNEFYMSIGDAIDQEDNYDKLEREINNIKERLSDVESELAVVRRIAEGKNTAYIFDTVDAMNEWLAVPENTAKLRVGDSLWIREQDVPDYWWDGTQALEQEGPKVDLSPYYTKDEINNIVNDINQKIEDKSTSIIFDTYIQMKSFVDDPTNADKLKEGTILLIREKNVPDYYYDGAGIVKMEADVEQCLYVTLTNKPTESTVSYTQDREVTNFAPGAIARWVDADGNDVFYKLVEIVGGKAKWITLIDTKYGNVTLQSTYDKNYEIVNIVSGSRLQAINSEKNDIKFVNSATGNVTVVLNGTVSGGAKKLVSMLAVNEVVLTPGASVSFTRNGDEFVLTELFGVTIFPDLADANREGEWVMSVGVTGKPILMEVKEMRKWDESITKELTIDELNEKFPNVDIGFAVVCKTINKVYEMVNGYKEWVSYDITSIS